MQESFAVENIGEGWGGGVRPLRTPLNSPLIKDLSKNLQFSWCGIAADGSCDETDKYLPVLVRYEGPDGLIQTSLLDMPNINVGPDAQTMFNAIYYVIKGAKLSWDYCMAYSSGNTSSMVRKKNSLLTKIKNAQQCG